MGEVWLWDHFFNIGDIAGTFNETALWPVGNKDLGGRFYD